jgi:hypothetical protein
MGLLKDFLAFLGFSIKKNKWVTKDELDHFEEKLATIITDFLVKKVRSGSDLAKKFRIHNTGFSVPDILKRNLIVDTNTSDLHRIHYGSGSKKAKSMRIYADTDPKHWLAPQLF